MPTVGARSSNDRAAIDGGAPRARPIAAGEGWSVSDLLCGAGPSDRPFEERHDGFSIAAVIEGAFTYKSDRGDAFLHAGALLLGNHGRCFSCGHDHGVGDRCIAFSFAPEVFEEIAASAAGSSRFRFRAGSAPADRAAAPIVAYAEAIARERSPLPLEESALRLAERVIATISRNNPAPVRTMGRETRRIAEALRIIEARAAEPLDLATLAASAHMSKYHFLRVFRRVAGATPHQALLSARMRQAADRLLSSSDTIAAIAFDAGFGDLSTFNHRFRADFGRTPSRYRRDRGA